MECVCNYVMYSGAYPRTVSTYVHMYVFICVHDIVLMCAGLHVMSACVCISENDNVCVYL